MTNPNLPFPRGTTAGVTATTDLVELEGKEYLVFDPDYGQYVMLKCVRNDSGIALEAKRLVTFQSGYYGKRIDGYARLPATESYPIDEEMGSATVPDNDLCYIVVKGPCLVKTSLGGNAENVLTALDYVMSITAATSQCTTAGRLIAATYAITGNTAVTQLKEIMGALGRCITARTTDNTNTDTLVHIGLKW